MIKVAFRMEWLERDPFVNYKQKFDKIEREFLSDVELNKIEHEDIKRERLQLGRDLFIFSCYIGLSYIDTINF